MSAAGQGPTVSRRAVVTSAVGLGAAAACGTTACGPPAPTAVTGPPGTRAAEPPTASAGLQPPRPRAPRSVAATGDIPVGGGQVFPELRVVVTQPTAGQFRGFGIVCTHDGCELTGVAGGTINCPCHGSRFALADGSVVRGPARTGLRVERIAVEGDEILLL